MASTSRGGERAPSAVGSTRAGAPTRCAAAVAAGRWRRGAPGGRRAARRSASRVRLPAIPAARDELREREVLLAKGNTSAVSAASDGSAAAAFGKSSAPPAEGSGRSSGRAAAPATTRPCGGARRRRQPACAVDAYTSVPRSRRAHQEVVDDRPLLADGERDERARRRAHRAAAGLGAAHARSPIIPPGGAEPAPRSQSAPTAAGRRGGGGDRRGGGGACEAAATDVDADTRPLGGRRRRRRRRAARRGAPAAAAAAATAWSASIRRRRAPADALQQLRDAVDLAHAAAAQPPASARGTARACQGARSAPAAAERRRRAERWPGTRCGRRSAVPRAARRAKREGGARPRRW